MEKQDLPYTFVTEEKSVYRNEEDLMILEFGIPKY